MNDLIKELRASGRRVGLDEVNAVLSLVVGWNTRRPASSATWSSRHATRCARYSRVASWREDELVQEELIGTVDVWELKSGIRWMIMRAFARRFVEEVELGRYMRELLKTRQWSVVRVVPHINPQGLPSTHVFDVYGVPAINPTPGAPTARAIGQAAQRG